MTFIDPGAIILSSEGMVILRDEDVRSMVSRSASGPLMVRATNDRCTNRACQGANSACGNEGCP
jgi:hypothetical protein